MIYNQLLLLSGSNYKLQLRLGFNETLKHLIVTLTSMYLVQKRTVKATVCLCDPVTHWPTLCEVTYMCAGLQPFGPKSKIQSKFAGLWKAEKKFKLVTFNDFTYVYVFIIIIVIIIIIYDSWRHKSQTKRQGHSFHTYIYLIGKFNLCTRYSLLHC